MNCKRCGKELIEAAMFCPYCGTSTTAEETPAADSAVSQKEYNRKLEQLFKLERKYKKEKRYKIVSTLLAIVFVVLLVGISVKCCESYARYLADRYANEIEKIAQEETDKYYAFTSEFANAVLGNREQQNTSCLVTPENTTAANDYIASLYKRSLDRVSYESYMGKSYYLITDILAFDRYPFPNTASNTIFPGAIIKGDSLFTGNCTVLAAEQMPVSLMSDQTDGKPITVTDPNYTNVTLALNEYAKEYTGDFSKEWSYTVQSASSTQELNFALGIGSDKSVGLDIGLNSSTQMNTVAIVYSQIYYTVSAEPKSNAADYFKEGVDLKTLGTYAPAYVSSVDYGRKIILTVSGDLSKEELSAKVSSHISGVDISAGIEKVNQDKELSSHLFSYGGEDISWILQTSDTEADTETGFWGFAEKIMKAWSGDNEEESIIDKLNDFLGSDASLVNPVPISYTLKYLSDNAIVPTMYITREFVLGAENAQIINISSASGKEFSLNISDLPAAIISEGAFSLTEATGTSFQLLCADFKTLPITVTYQDRKYSLDLADCEIEETDCLVVYGDSTGFLGLTRDDNYIEIRRTKYIKNLQ